MRHNRIFIMLLLTVLGLSACSSQKQKLSGKYIDIYDETHYLGFNEDGSFVDNFLTTTSKGITSISDNYIYKINDKGFITIIDTQEYEFQDSLQETELGWLYNDSIGTFWDGILPVNNNETSINCLLNNHKFEYHFNNDETYEYTAYFNNEIIHTGNGVYTINNNEIICTNEDGITTTFINTKDRVFCVEYIKE